jgi:hypothetical protein
MKKPTSELAKSEAEDLDISDPDLLAALEESEVEGPSVAYLVRQQIHDVTPEMRHAMVEKADRQYAEPVRARGRYALAIVALAIFAALGLVLCALAMTDWDKDIIKLCVPAFVVGALTLGGASIWKFVGFKEK